MNRNTFPKIITSIPVSSFRFAHILTGILFPDVKHPHKLPCDTANLNAYFLGFQKHIGDPRLRIEGVGVVLQKRILLYYSPCGYRLALRIDGLDVVVQEPNWFQISFWTIILECDKS